MFFVTEFLRRNQKYKARLTKTTFSAKSKAVYET